MTDVNDEPTSTDNETVCDACAAVIHLSDACTGNHGETLCDDCMGAEAMGDTGD